MKEAFCNIYQISINNQKIFYAPCIRVVAKNHRHFRNSWDVFIERLKEII